MDDFPRFSHIYAGPTIHPVKYFMQDVIKKLEKGEKNQEIKY